jgi:uncharacterized protein YecE (DUF72 family)
MKNWWIGCSGFHYKAWRGEFYPPELPQRRWFEYYCEHFNSVELNVTFYRFPKPGSLKSWYTRSPDEFKFTVKAPRLITHYKRFHNAFRETSEFYDSVLTGLKEKLGTVLFQLHPGITFSDGTMERILETLNPAFCNVLEFRHESWWNKSAIKSLKKHGISFCSISYPHLPDHVIKSAGVIYYRFHGVPKLYLSSYSDSKLSEIAESIGKFRRVSDVYCYFNNDIEVAAVFNAKKLQAITESINIAR